MIQNYNFKEVEPGMMTFWEDKEIYKKLKAKNKGKKKYYFLNGPPYTSGRIHIGTAWNNALKDIIVRYQRMKGLDVWDRYGYDMHGLPTENRVQADLKLQDKNAIKNYGMDKFIRKCIDFSLNNVEMMNNDLLRLGVWLDYDHAYFTIKNTYMENEWWIVKRAHEEKRLYKGKRIMHWCASCETALAKHELGYHLDHDTSIFLKFKLADKENEYLIIWTTTPWTVLYNLAVMVNPKLDYIKAKVNNEIWIVAKGLAEAVIKTVADKEFSVVEEFKGKALEGTKYRHPLYEELKEQFAAHKKRCKNPNNIFTILLSEQYVSLDTGSGLVHAAPGCGPEDYEVGRKYGIAPFNNLNEKGIFENMGPYTGFKAKTDDKKFIEVFKEKECLLATTQVEHDYAHCWRCHEPVIFRATEQWFLKIEDLLPKMIEDNKKINWVPKFGSHAFDAWLGSLKDNSITRQRFWGCPVPIWECAACKKIQVIGSRAELAEKATNAIPKDLHIPWIDEVKLKCSCGKPMMRIPDVLDVWIDSGSAAFNCIDYPLDQKTFKELFPADLVLEGTDQVRLWFSMMHILSEIAIGRNCFKNVYMHGMILDFQGMKMSKSKGNIISPYEVIDKYGADVLRYYMCAGNAGETFNFNWETIKIKQRNLMVLWHIHKLLINLCQELSFNPLEAKENELVFGKEEKYILSRLHNTIQHVTDLFEKYHIDQTIERMEALFLAISRSYLQFVREKSSIGTEKERRGVAYTLYQLVYEFLKMFSLICPFISEVMFLNLKEAFQLKQESIHLHAFPQADKTKINIALEQAMDHSALLIQAVLYAREKAKLGVRWPVKKVIIQTTDKDVVKAVQQLKKIIMLQTNVKTIEVKESVDGVITTIQADYQKLRPDFLRKACTLLVISRA